MSVQKVPYPNNGGPRPDGQAPRIETGAVQFGNDWPGLFVRGDESFTLVQAIDVVERLIGEHPNDLDVTMSLAYLRDLRATIRESVII